MVCLSPWHPLDSAVILLPNILMFVALWLIQECAHVVSACFFNTIYKTVDFFFLLSHISFT